MAVLQRIMKIAIVTRRLSGQGGMETAISSLMRAGHARPDTEIELWLMGRPNDERWLGALTTRIAAMDRGPRFRFQLAPKLPLYVWALYRWLREAGPMNALWVTEPLLMRAARLARGRAKVPLIYSWIHFPPSRLAHVGSIAAADRHYAISQGIADAIQALAPASHPLVVFNPLPEAPKMLFPVPHRPTFLYVGRLANAQKRVDVLLAGLARLRHPGWQLHIVGDGPDRGRLEHLARDLGLDRQVEWHGWQSQAWRTVGGASCFCLTSDYEGFPMVLLEAMARGIPAIATDCPTGPRDIIVPGQNGYLIPPGNDEAFADAALHFFDRVKPVAWTRRRIQEETIRRFDPARVLDRMLMAVPPVL